MLSASFHVVCFAAKYLGEQEFLTPPLAAWLPMLAFGPAALAMFDAIHT
jgi:lipopolysaccharide export system permease protein